MDALLKGKPGSPPECSDSDLYSAFLSGDSTAYDKLMIRHGDSLTAYLYGYLHDWHDAEDLMIEAFARIMVKKPQIRDGGFKAYLFKTARHYASRFHAKMTRRKTFSFEEMNEEMARGLVTDAAPDQEKKEVLKMCLSQIDPAMREALCLVYLEGMSYAQAASVMGISMKKIDHLLANGKQHMRRELEKEGVMNAYE